MKAASVPYGAAKGGLLTFTRSSALELAPLQINVNAIAGLIRTPMTAMRTAKSPLSPVAAPALQDQCPALVSPPADQGLTACARAGQPVRMPGWSATIFAAASRKASALALAAGARCTTGTAAATAGTLRLGQVEARRGAGKRIR